MASKIADLMSAGLLGVSIGDLADMTDRQIHAFWFSGRGDKNLPPEEKALPPGVPRSPAPQKTPPERIQSRPDGSIIHRDPEHPNDPRFAWRIPRASEEAVCDIDGIPIDGEAILHNLAAKGILKPADVKRVIELKRERDARRAAEAKEKSDGEGE